MSEEFQVTIAMEERKQAIESIRQYNVQFLSSSAVMATIAVIGSLAADKFDGIIVDSIFCIIPTIYFLTIYNLLKYTIVQRALGTYVERLERFINQKLGDYITIWEISHMTSSKTYDFLFAFIQTAYFVPLGIFVINVFLSTKSHDVLWWVALISGIIQIGITVVMGIHLINTQNDANAKFRKFNFLTVLDAEIIQDDNEPTSLPCPDV